MRKENTKKPDKIKKTITISFEENDYLELLFNKAKTGSLATQLSNYLIKEKFFCNSLNPILLEEYKLLKKIYNFVFRYSL